MECPTRFFPAMLASLLLFFVGAFVFTPLLLDSSIHNLVGNSPQDTIVSIEESPFPRQRKAPLLPKPLEVPLDCAAYNRTRTCPSNYPDSSDQDHNRPFPPTCPDYFRWIHEDLKPWAYTGISRDTFESANRTAAFKLVIKNGKAYYQKYVKAFQSRDTFTLWGILQLLLRYPGKVPDLELMFDCVDWPVISSSSYTVGPNSTSPPPLFRYCGDNNTLDIVFPDWTFWGWPETNIAPWEKLLHQLEEGNRRRKWVDREPYAYWKGNPKVAETRQDLMKCNVSEEHEWNARLYTQNWTIAEKEGFKRSDLTSQCVHRYKIYIEGSAWSVSNKYILACDSMTLLVKPRYYDFYIRGLTPGRQYWPIKADDKCKSIKYAVDWGNKHPKKAQKIGKAASKYIQEDLKMDYVYDYMFHLLNEYAKLLSFEPSVPPEAIELCSETMACQAEGLEKKFMMESMVKGPTVTEPCNMPPPYDPSSLFSLLRRRSNIIRRVETLEESYWKIQNKQ